MKNKWSCNPSEPARANRARLAAFILGAVCVLTSVPQCLAGDAPSWMHALVNAPLPTHDEKTDAVLLYSETNVNVISADKIKTTVRRAYKILRPDGREYGFAFASFRSAAEK